MKKVFENLIHEGMERIKISTSNLNGTIRNSYTIIESKDNTFSFKKKNTRPEVTNLL